MVTAKAQTWKCRRSGTVKLSLAIPSVPGVTGVSVRMLPRSSRTKYRSATARSCRFLIEESSARALASREAAALDPDLDWRQTWAGVLARLEQERERRRAARLGIERPGSDEALRAFQDTHKRLKARQHST